MEHFERMVEAGDGTRLSVTSWVPRAKPRFVVMIAHGGAEHVERFAHVATFLAAHGGYVFGPDHRGQGHSAGLRGHVERFEQYSDDLLHVALDERRLILERGLDPNMPWFLFGHSMGGLIALLFLLDHAHELPLRGAIISSPLLALTMKVPPLKLALGKLAAKLMPTLALSAGIPASAISRDPAVVAAYEDDPRRATLVTAAWFEAMQAATARVDQEVTEIDVPTLWYVGTGDRICDHHETTRVFNKLGALKPTHTLQTFEGYYHELHNEPAEQQQTVLDAIWAFIRERIGG